MPQGTFFGRAGINAGALLHSPDYWLSSIDTYAEAWPEAQRARLEDLRHQGARLAYWRSDKNGLPCNRPSDPKGEMPTIYPVQATLVQIVRHRGRLKLCSKTALHATLKPPLWKGSRVWVVALIGEVIGDADKFGAQQREFLGEISEIPTEWSAP